MASFADDFKKEARSANGRAVFRTVRGHLGKMLRALGCPDIAATCKTPFETTDPNDVHYWMWEEPTN